MLLHAAGRVDCYRRTGEVTAWLENDLSTQKMRKNMEEQIQGMSQLQKGGFPMVMLPLSLRTGAADREKEWKYAAK